MTATTSAAESPATRCSICTRPAGSGSRLCDQCKAAVKRARQVPSLHPGFLPQTGTGTPVAGFAGAGHMRAPPARRATRTGLPPIPGGWGIYATLVVFGAAVSLTGYFATGMQGDEASRERVLLAAPAASAVDTRSETVSRAQPAASSPAADEQFAADEGIAQIEWTAPPAPSARVPGGLPTRKPERAAPSAAKGYAPPPAFDARSIVAESQPAQVAARHTEVPVPTPETQAPATPDRWQLLAVALSRCERENALVGLFCKERARLQYCEGHWGDAPQCPGVALSRNTR